MNDRRAGKPRYSAYDRQDRSEKERQRLMIRAHEGIDSLCKRSASGDRVRSRVYEALAEALGIDRAECHMGLLSVEQLRRVPEICGGLVTEAASPESEFSCT